jgi:hypothetical protein
MLLCFVQESRGGSGDRHKCVGYIFPNNALPFPGKLPTFVPYPGIVEEYLPTAVHDRLPLPLATQRGGTRLRMVDAVYNWIVALEL